MVSAESSLHRPSALGTEIVHTMSPMVCTSFSRCTSTYHESHGTSTRVRVRVRVLGLGLGLGYGLGLDRTYHGTSTMLDLRVAAVAPGGGALME